MKNVKILLMTVLVLSISSCTTTMSFTQLANADQQQQLERNRNIHIAEVSDGAFVGRVFAGSGATVANFFTVYMRPFAAQITSEEEAYYIVNAVITHWEPRAAAWSGIPTQVRMHVSIVERASRNEVINKELSIRGRSVTWASQSAEGLAEYMIRNFVSEIFQ